MKIICFDTEPNKPKTKMLSAIGKHALEKVAGKGDVVVFRNPSFYHTDDIEMADVIVIDEALKDSQLVKDYEAGIAIETQEGDRAKKSTVKAKIEFFKGKPKTQRS